MRAVMVAVSDAIEEFFFRIAGQVGRDDCNRFSDASQSRGKIEMSAIKEMSFKFWRMVESSSAMHCLR